MADGGRDDKGHFLKGTPKPPTSGRRAGTPNKATGEFKQFLRGIFESQEYRDKVKDRILKGKAPDLEKYMLQLLYGKPPESVQVSNPDGSPIQFAQIYLPAKYPKPKPGNGRGNGHS